MLYLGLDVHSKWMRVEGFNPLTGETISIPKVANDRESIVAAFKNLDEPLHGAMEIGTNAWAVYWMLLEFFEDLVVVDALTTWGREPRRGAKTDKRDALKLAEKLYRGELSRLYIPDKCTQDYRCLIRARVNATRRVTQTVNEIGSILRSWGIIVEFSLLTKRGKGLLEASRTKLPKNSLLVLDGLLEELYYAIKQEERLTDRIKEIAQEDEICKILVTAPNVGPLTAFAMRAEVGDINRFPSVKHLISYVGLGPVVHQSAGQLHYGGLPRSCNKILRYFVILRASSVSNTKEDNPIRRAYFRAALKGHVNDGKINAARKLLRIMYAMMKRKECWDAEKAAA